MESALTAHPMSLRPQCGNPVLHHGDAEDTEMIPFLLCALCASVVTLDNRQLHFSHRGHRAHRENGTADERRFTQILWGGLCRPMSFPRKRESRSSHHRGHRASDFKPHTSNIKLRLQTSNFKLDTPPLGGIMLTEAPADKRATNESSGPPWAG